MLILETVAVAFSLFSALPLPCLSWNRSNQRYALCAFPLVGVAVGLVWWGWFWLCGVLEVSGVVQAAGLCLLPVVLTGGIHLDGYADTCDALASCAGAEKKREILQDPRCGAFAVIRLCVYFLAYFAICYEFAITVKVFYCAVIPFVLSRCLSGFAIATLPLAKDTGLAYSFADSADRKTVRLVLALLATMLTALLCLLGGWQGATMAVVAGLVFWHYAHVAKTQFGGISGDLAGWFLQRTEFWMLAVLVLCQRLEGLR